MTTIVDRIEHWPVGRLVEFDRNPRTHSADQIEKIAASIREFGFVNPCLVDGDGVLIKRMLQNSTQRGDITMDLFGGSGSTLIACEKLGRVAKLMELDPRFVDVIVHRWQEFTGRDARLESTGQTFEEVRASRSGNSQQIGQQSAVVGS